jgi:hypothetical protein
VGGSVTIDTGYRGGPGGRERELSGAAAG